jgi:hypothetical protein
MNNRVMWVAGFRSLYLQVLHPRVMRASWQNSSFTDPQEAWGRLFRTRMFVLTRSYRTTAEAERTGRRVYKIHGSVTGTEPDGTAYRVDEPGLLLWVHCGGSRLSLTWPGAPPCRSPRQISTHFVDEQRRGDPAKPVHVRRGDGGATAHLPSAGARRQPRDEASAAEVQRLRVLDAAALSAPDVRQAGRPADRRRGDGRAPCHTSGGQLPPGVPGGDARGAARRRTTLSRWLASARHS